VVTKRDLARVLQACATTDPVLEVVKAERLCAAFADMDSDGDGSVSFDDFLAGIRRDPFLAKALLSPNLHFRRYAREDSAEAAAAGGGAAGGGAAGAEGEGAGSGKGGWLRDIGAAMRAGTLQGLATRVVRVLDDGDEGRQQM